MAIFIDALLLALFAFTVIKNWHGGFMRAVLGMGRLIISFLAALGLGSVSAELWVSDTDGIAVPIIGFIIVFVVTFIAITVVMFLVSKIKLPVITKADKLLGLLLGIVLGAIYVSLISTTVYSVIELLDTLGNETAMSVYTDSRVFRFVYDLKIFEFVRSILK